MAHKCPRCGNPVQRGYSSSAQIAAGLIGALIYSAFGGFHCRLCGKIPNHEFPPEVRAKMTATTIVMVLCALAIGGVILAFITNSGK